MRETQQAHVRIDDAKQQAMAKVDAAKVGGFVGGLIVGRLASRN